MIDRWPGDCVIIQLLRQTWPLEKSSFLYPNKVDLMWMEIKQTTHVQASACWFVAFSHLRFGRLYRCLVVGLWNLTNIHNADSASLETYWHLECWREESEALLWSVPSVLVWKYLFGLGVGQANRANTQIFFFVGNRVGWVKSFERTTTCRALILLKQNLDCGFADCSVLPSNQMTPLRQMQPGFVLPINRTDHHKPQALVLTHSLFVFIHSGSLDTYLHVIILLSVGLHGYYLDIGGELAMPCLSWSIYPLTCSSFICPGGVCQLPGEYLSPYSNGGLQACAAISKKASLNIHRRSSLELWTPSTRQSE